jgi:hypothetical protein
MWPPSAALDVDLGADLAALSETLVNVITTGASGGRYW